MDKLIAMIVPPWDKKVDADGLSAFPEPETMNERCIIDRAFHREYLIKKRFNKTISYLSFILLIGFCLFVLLLLGKL